MLRGWIVPLEVIAPGDVCYCAGVGEDIEFEMALLRLRDVAIVALDPTPRAAAFVARATPPSSFKFLPVGLYSANETLRFYAPLNPTHVSHSIVPGDKDRAFFDAPCRRLGSLMTEFGHPHLGLLKLNIEGAEYAVLRSLIEDEIRPTIIALTFEGSTAFRDAVRWTRRLRKYGYEFVGLSGWAATFVLRECSEGHAADTQPSVGAGLSA